MCLRKNMMHTYVTYTSSIQYVIANVKESLGQFKALCDCKLYMRVSITFGFPAKSPFNCYIKDVILVFTQYPGFQ